MRVVVRQNVLLWRKQVFLIKPILYESPLDTTKIVFSNARLKNATDFTDLHGKICGNQCNQWQHIVV